MVCVYFQIYLKLRRKVDGVCTNIDGYFKSNVYEYFIFFNHCEAVIPIQTYLNYVVRVIRLFTSYIPTKSHSSASG